MAVCLRRTAVESNGARECICSHNHSHAHTQRAHATHKSHTHNTQHTTRNTRCLFVGVSAAAQRDLRRRAILAWAKATLRPARRRARSASLTARAALVRLFFLFSSLCAIVCVVAAPPCSRRAAASSRVAEADFRRGCVARADLQCKQLAGGVSRCYECPIGQRGCACDPGGSCLGGESSTADMRALLGACDFLPHAL